MPEKRMGTALKFCTDGCPFLRPLPPWEFKDYLGWMEQGDGRLAYGVFVQNGRLASSIAFSGCLM